MINHKLNDNFKSHIILVLTQEELVELLQKMTSFQVPSQDQIETHLDLTQRINIRLKSQS